MSRDRGALALVLHSHMPYVEGFGTWPFGEEWLWEAMATVYLPLLDLLDRARRPAHAGPHAGAVRPARDAAGRRRATACSGSCATPRRAVHDEDAGGLERTGEPELAAEVRRAGGDYERRAAALADRRPRPAGRRWRGWPTAARWSCGPPRPPTRVLPLLASDAGVRLQLATGIASHERRFGGFGGGFWLPECAYEPGLERELAEHGVRAFCVDQTAAHGLGAPEQLEPVLTEAGVVAVPIDWQTVELVWNDQTRLPGARRLPRLPPPHRARPAPVEQRPAGAYDPDAAAAQAREHARDFVRRCIERLDAYAAERGRPGLLCCALDTELLGHWWYEGQAVAAGAWSRQRASRGWSWPP